MKYKVLIFLFLAMIFLLPTLLYAHGVKNTVEKGGINGDGAYDVMTRYKDKKPLREVINDFKKSLL